MPCRDEHAETHVEIQRRHLARDRGEPATTRGISGNRTSAVRQRIPAARHNPGPIRPKLTCALAAAGL